MDDGDRSRSLLLGALDAQRRHVLAAVDGLTDAQLRAAVLPSGWSPIGLVRHLTLGGERYWIHTVMAGEPLDYWPIDRPELDEGRPADWRVEPHESTDAVLDEYRDAIARSDGILAALPLDAAPRHREPDWQAERFADLEAVLLHVILDAATHAGHLDAARELLDGRQHLVL
ncbi:DinB family protein [Agrococcus lahaulensis]|uniref:DinB family protein n=1 Tax=Agrococcus lahaulensis TaxID=341722 RepID=UPI0004242172|nr:DinB family protein [Agrococcus lahaulensis]